MSVFESVRVVADKTTWYNCMHACSYHLLVMPASLVAPCLPTCQVWDEDHIRAAQGSDDSLGLLRCPFHRLLREGGEVDIKQKLEDSTLVLNVRSWYRYTSLLANCPAQGDYNWRAARADPL